MDSGAWQPSVQPHVLAQEQRLSAEHVLRCDKPLNGWLG